MPLGRDAAQLRTRLLEGDVAHDRDLLRGKRLAGPAENLLDRSGRRAAVLARDEVRRDHVIGREGLEAGHGDPHVVSTPAELVRRTGVAAAARPGGELVIEDSGRGKRLPRGAHVLPELPEPGWGPPP